MVKLTPNLKHVNTFEYNVRLKHGLLDPFSDPLIFKMKAYRVTHFNNIIAILFYRDVIETKTVYSFLYQQFGKTEM